MEPGTASATRAIPSAAAVASFHLRVTLLMPRLAQGLVLCPLSPLSSLLSPLSSLAPPPLLYHLLGAGSSHGPVVREEAGEALKHFHERYPEEAIAIMDKIDGNVPLQVRHSTPVAPPPQSQIDALHSWRRP